MGGGCYYSCYVSKRDFRPPKIRGLGLRRTEEKFADSDANSESVTTLIFIVIDECIAYLTVTDYRKHALEPGKYM